MTEPTNPAERLKKARSLRFATASEAARYLGLATPTYLAHENGTRNITWDQAEYYGRKFRIRTEWLLSGRGDMSDDPETERLTPLSSSLARASTRYTSANPLFAMLQIGYSPDGMLRPLPGARDAEPALLPPLDQTQGYIPEIVVAEANAAEARREIRLPGVDPGRHKLVIDDFIRLPRDALNLDYAVSIRFGDGSLIEGSSGVDRMIVNPLDRTPDRSGFYAGLLGSRLKPILADFYQDPQSGGRGLAVSESRFAPGIAWPGLSDSQSSDSIIVGRAERVFINAGAEIERTLKQPIYESQRKAMATTPAPVVAQLPFAMGGGGQPTGILRAPLRLFAPEM